MRILVLGVGNPIMGDDGVGVQVARMVRDRLGPQAPLQVKELGLTGLRLVEELLGHDEVYIVDSYARQDAEPGRIREFAPEQFEDSLHPSSPQGTDFATALRFYNDIEPDRMPRKIQIFTVDIDRDVTFREGMSETVRQAAARLTETLAREIERSLAED